MDVFYVSQSKGNDNWDGQSPESPWKTLDRVNRHRFEPGQKVLFRSGDTWEGRLEISSRGTANFPIVYGQYAEGPKPVINGRGADYAVRIFNSSYVQVRNLDITNEGSERKPGRVGVLIKALDYGVSQEIVLDSLEVHHVNGSLVKAEGGGSAIRWENGGDSIPTRFDGLLIENCHLHHTGRNGITSRGYISRDKWFPSTGVVIRSNLLEQIPGDGIVPIGTDGTRIEYNIMRDSPDLLSHEEAAAGIWPWSSDNTLIQYNEVSGHKAKWDGQGFDADYNCWNTIIQYNYSHDNYGGFLLVCNQGNSLGEDFNKGTFNAIVRYNVSINDGIRPYPTERRGWFSPSMHITGPVAGTEISHNLIVAEPMDSPARKRIFIDMDNWGGPFPINTSITSNVFYSSDPAGFAFDGDTGTRFRGNGLSPAIAPESFAAFPNRNVVLERPLEAVRLRAELQENGNRVNREWIEGWLNLYLKPKP